MLDFAASATIFNINIPASGMMIFLAVLFVHKQFKKWLVSIPFGIFSLGLWVWVFFRDMLYCGTAILL